MRRTGVVVLSVVGIVFALTWALSSGDPAAPARTEEARPPRPEVRPPSPTAPPSSPQLQSEPRVEGVVIDAQRRTPIERAEVEFETETGTDRRLTDARGRFSVPIGKGSWLLAAVRANGYTTTNPELPIDGSTQELKLELSRIPERRGRVLDTAGRPVEGALIEPFAVMDFALRAFERTLSDPNGEFRLVADGVARVSVSHLCCVSANVPVGRAEDELVITLEPAKIERVTFKGIVVDEDDQPVEGAKISGIAHSRNREIAHPISARAGREGRFEVEVHAGATIELVAELGERTSGDLTFEGLDEAKLVLLEAASSVSGKVTNELGEPVKNFTITLDSSNFRKVREFSSSDGRFLFDGLPKLGTTIVDVRARDYLSASPDYFRLGRREHLTGVDFSLTRGLEVRGVVIDRETRHPLAGANVKVADPRLSLGPNGRARTDALGRFTVGGLKPGRVELLVTRSGYVGHNEVADTANQAELRIGLTSSSNPNAKDEYVGVGMQFANLNVDAGAGYFVKSLHPQGGALVAGVRVGDEILAANGVAAGTIETADFLLHIKGDEGSLVTLTVRREGKTFDVHAVRRRLSATW